MKNSTHKHSHEIQLSFMGFGTPNLPDCLDDITTKIESKWNGVKRILSTWGEQLKLILNMIMPKIFFDFKKINKMIENRYEELGTPDKYTANHLLWNKYRNWKKQFISSYHTNIENIPNFVFFMD